MTSAMSSLFDLQNISVTYLYKEITHTDVTSKMLTFSIGHGSTAPSLVFHTAEVRWCCRAVLEQCVMLGFTGAVCAPRVVPWDWRGFVLPDP